MFGLDIYIVSHILDISMKVFQKDDDYENCCSFIHLKMRLSCGLFYSFREYTGINGIYIFAFGSLKELFENFERHNLMF